MSTLTIRSTVIFVALILGVAVLAFGAGHRYTVSHIGHGYIIRTDRLTGKSQACELVESSPPAVHCGDVR